MRWAKQSRHLAISDTMPPYRVARFAIASLVQYRASIGGEFIGAVCTDPKAAQAICERHHLITGNREAANG